MYKLLKKNKKQLLCFVNIEVPTLILFLWSSFVASFFESVALQ